MKYNEVTFYYIAPLIRSIQVSSNTVTIHANYEVISTSNRNNFVSSLKNLKTIRDALQDIIHPASDESNSVLVFKYDASSKHILDKLIQIKKRHDALEILRNNGGISISEYERLLFNNDTRAAVMQIMNPQKNR